MIIQFKLKKNWKSFANFSYLKILSLNENRLKFLPEIFNNLLDLQFVNLDNNKLTTLVELSNTLKILL